MNEIYAAIYDRLTDQLDCPVYDNVPQDGFDFPYVRLDPLVMNNNDSDLENAFNSSVQVIGYSRYQGSKEVADINLSIYNALHRYAMANTATYGISAITQEFSSIVLSGDGKTRQSIQRFNILFEPLP